MTSPSKYPKSAFLLSALLCVASAGAVEGCYAAGGFAKDDAAADRAAQILLDRCTPSDLAAFSQIYTASLRQSKGDYLHIAAKAKTVEARQFVEKMALQAKWRDEPERRHAIRLAQAALGNTRIENEFIDAAVQAERSAPPAPRFCTRKLGAVFNGPTPDLPPDQPYPTGMLTPPSRK